MRQHSQPLAGLRAGLVPAELLPDATGWAVVSDPWELRLASGLDRTARVVTAEVFAALRKEEWGDGTAADSVASAFDDGTVTPALIRDRSRNDLPKRLILVGQPARLVVSAHVPGFDLPACGRAFAFLASPDLPVLLLSALPSVLSDLPSTLATSVGTGGFASGRGILRPA